jgi:hypothetical protein
MILAEITSRPEAVATAVGVLAGAWVLVTLIKTL